MVRCILPYILCNVPIPEEFNTRYEQIKGDVQEGSELLKQELKNIQKEYPSSTVPLYASFLENEFIPWADATISPRAIMMNQFKFSQQRLSK